MSKKLLTLALLAALPGAAFAKKSPDAEKKAEQVLAAALGDMRDSAGISEELMRALDAAGIQVGIETGMKEMARYHEIPADIPVKEIEVSVAAAKMSHPHVGAYVAEQAALIAYEDMPDCAEKDFMVLSATARSFFEMHGTRAKSPYFEGVKDETLAGKIETWTSTDMTGYVREMGEKGRPTLAGKLAQTRKDLEETLGRADEQISSAERDGMDLRIDALRAARKLAEAQGKMEIKALEDAAARAKQFAEDESNWLMTNQGLVH